MERVCVESDKLNNKSVHVELRYDTLVEKAKSKMSSFILNRQEEERVEAKDMKKETDGECVSCARMEFFEQRSADSESEEGNDLL